MAAASARARAAAAHLSALAGRTLGGTPLVALRRARAGRHAAIRPLRRLAQRARGPRRASRSGGAPPLAGFSSRRRRTFDPGRSSRFTPLRFLSPFAERPLG